MSRHGATSAVPNRRVPTTAGLSRHVRTIAVRNRRGATSVDPHKARHREATSEVPRTIVVTITDILSSREAISEVQLGLVISVGRNHAGISVLRGNVTLIAGNSVPRRGAGLDRRVASVRRNAVETSVRLLRSGAGSVHPLRLAVGSARNAVTIAAPTSVHLLRPAVALTLVTIAATTAGCHHLLRVAVVNV